MTTPATIEIPRHPDESPRAYAARVAYVTMGPSRSIDKVAQQSGSKTTARSRHYMEWSRRYEWVETARRYDDTLATLAARKHQEEYEAQIEAFRRETLAKSDSLSSMLDGLESRVKQALVGKPVPGADGREYWTPALDIDASALNALIRGRLVAADMKAHALDLPRIIAAGLKALGITEGEGDA